MIAIATLMYWFMRFCALDKLTTKESYFYPLMTHTFLYSYLMFYVCYFAPVSYSVNKVDASQNDEISRSCKYCFSLKKPKRKHCRACLSCVDNYHHHCYFFDKCIDTKGFFFLCVLVSFTFPSMALTYFYVGKKILAIFY